MNRVIMPTLAVHTATAGPELYIIYDLDARAQVGLMHRSGWPQHCVNSLVRRTLPPGANVA